MNTADALKRYDELTADGKDAVIFGNLVEYLIAQDAETLIEQALEEVALAGPDTWKAIQGCLARRDALGLGNEILDACKSLVATYAAELNELAGYAQDCRDDAMTRHPRRVCGGLLPFDDDLGDATRYRRPHEQL